MAEKITISMLTEAKKNRKRFAVVSCYDYTSAVLSAAGGAEMILVGDSAAQFMLGYDSTLPVTMDFMVAITAGVRRAGTKFLLAADMPYLASQGSDEQVVKNAKRFIVEAGADIVKLEATAEQISTVRAMVDADVATMAHIGIRPQTGIFKANATTAADAVELIKLADDMAEAGAAMLLLEGVTRRTAGVITKRLDVPVISCGSGPECDGQVLVLPDILNLLDGPKPKFAQSFGNVGNGIIDVVRQYCDQVRDGLCPDDEHSYHMKSGEFEKLNKEYGIQLSEYGHPEQGNE